MLRATPWPSDELLHLDFLRFVAACGIVLLHFARFLSAETRALIGPLHGLTILVDLFFMISGFVIAYFYMGQLIGWRGYAAFLQRRVARLGPLHWATFVVFLAIGLTIWSGRMSSDHSEFYDRDCILPNILAINAWGMCKSLSFNDVSWSISAEMGMYLIVPLLFVVARSPLALATMAIATIAALSLAPSQPWLEWTSHFGVARALPSFALGIVLMRCQAHIAQIPAARAVACAAFALLLAGVRMEWERIMLLPVAYIIVMATVAADLGRCDSPPKIGVLGQLTYSLYMLHPVVRTVVISFGGQRLLRLQGLGADLMVLLGFVLTFVLSYVSFVYFETPARRWLSRPWQRSVVQKASKEKGKSGAAIM